MSQTGKIDAKKCCTTEKQRLMAEIRKCDFCSTSWESHHRCLSQAAKASGERSRSCMIS